MAMKTVGNSYSGSSDFPHKKYKHMICKGNYAINVRGTVVAHIF